MVKVPLYLKLMASYVTVVLLVVLPTFVYVRAVQGREVRRHLQESLQSEVASWADRLGRVPPEDLPKAVGFALQLSTERLTVIDASGAVLGDSVARDRSLDNHLARPEVRQALESEDGFGASERHSSTLDGDEIYTAARFPRTGQVRGVVRLATAPAAIYKLTEDGLVTLARAGALAASAAVIWSLLAAFLVSRPLGQIVRGARALAAGDFGHRIALRAGDELGEVAKALEDLASRLRDRLHAGGADRAALRALVDDLPVGVVLYASDGAPDVINGRARVLCGMTPDLEQERALSLREMPSQVLVVERVLRDGFTLEAACELPWSPASKVRARWIALPLPDGGRRAGVVLLDETGPVACRRHATLLAEAADRLREASRSGVASALATALQATAARCDDVVALDAPAVADVRVCTLAALWDAVRADVAAVGGATVEADLSEPAVALADVGRRVERGLRELLIACARQARPGEKVTWRGEVADCSVRLVADGVVSAVVLEALGKLVGPIGGDVGTTAADGGAESWLVVPRG